MRGPTPLGIVPILVPESPQVAMVIRASSELSGRSDMAGLLHRSRWVQLIRTEENGGRTIVDETAIFITRRRSRNR
jgi:hypothetical protein